MSYVIWITGECGAGKTTIGRAVANRTGSRFIDNDDLKYAIMPHIAGRDQTGRLAYSLLLSIVQTDLLRGTSVVVAAPISTEETLISVRNLSTYGAVYIVELIASEDILDARLQHRAITLAPDVPAVRSREERLASYTHQNHVTICDALLVDTTNRLVSEVAGQLSALVDQPPALSLPALRRRLQRVARPLVMASGVFDLFHAGHLYYLSESSRHAATLVVQVATDSATARRKGDHRPFINFSERAKIVCSIRGVSAVFFSEYHPLKCAAELRADVVVVTEEVKDEFEALRGKEFTGEVVYIGRQPNLPATSLIAKRLVGVKHAEPSGEPEPPITRSLEP